MKDYPGKNYNIILRLIADAANMDPSCIQRNAKKLYLKNKSIIGWITDE